MIWCLHCERVSEVKVKNMIEPKCELCGACVPGDIWEWDSYRDIHPEAPLHPKSGDRYPMYGAKVIP